MVEVAAIIAHAASTALPPRSNIIAPAVAASGLPVIAIQCLPCSGGFCVLAIERMMAGFTVWPRAVSGWVMMSIPASVQERRSVRIVRFIAFHRSLDGGGAGHCAGGTVSQRGQAARPSRPLSVCRYSLRIVPLPVKYVQTSRS